MIATSTRCPAKKVYPSLKLNIQHFLSTKIIENIQIYHLNECNFDNYQFFQLMTFLGEIIELYLQQDNFLDNLMRTSNKETENKDSVLKIDVSCYSHSSPRGVFRTLFSI